MSETTDRKSQDTNPEVPRVLKRGSVEVTTSQDVGILKQGSVSITLQDVEAENNNIVDAYYRVGSAAARMFKVPDVRPVVTSDAGGNTIISYTGGSHMTMESDAGKLKITFTLTATSEITRTVYFVVYSSKITEDSIL